MCGGEQAAMAGGGQASGVNKQREDIVAVAYRRGVQRFGGQTGNASARNTKPASHQDTGQPRNNKQITVDSSAKMMSQLL